ncbi:alpha/beta-hydrolase [Daldinia caldariorum]|uniref:alpha/beta-hydrolase n=1 Tax=Daldinia caldariorum TaxID=326644 RepID=UPI002007EA86|nr:alpha/beta-hydrolase [Daldinia caldariorum]KAI1463876.1 alpha/beta-hydrolase [Daldinia caldariorum]
MTDNAEAHSSPPHQREVFYVGGQYVTDEAGHHTLQGQMYVERLIPVESDKYPKRPSPIVFIHGGTRSGADWLTKPDGQPGWASYFLSRGFECYLVDLPFCGRSPWHPGNGTMIALSAEGIQTMFTACRDLGTWPQAKLHTQWPGTGKIGDAVFDHFFASTQQILPDWAAQERASQAACAALLDRIGRPAVLVGHSAGAPTLWLAADARPALVRTVVAVEPAGAPFFRFGVASGPGTPYGVSNAPVTYEPPVANPDVDLERVIARAPGPDLVDCMLQKEKGEGGEEGGGDVGPRQLVNLTHLRALVVTAQASYHAQYDWAIVRYLRQAGVRGVEHLRLGERGIYGNGHMMFMERNSDEVAAEVVRWIEEE